MELLDFQSYKGRFRFYVPKLIHFNNKRVIIFENNIH